MLFSTCGHFGIARNAGRNFMSLIQLTLLMKFSALILHARAKDGNVPFADYLKASVLEPLGMERSSFSLDTEIKRTLAKAYMWTQGGQTFVAPTFELGMAPCGCMYSTVIDLGFLRKLKNDNENLEIQRIISALVDADWTADLNKKLAIYQEHAQSTD